MSGSWDNTPNYTLAEQELGKLKNGGALSYNHLKYISSSEVWPSFDKWYQWPTEDQIKHKLSETNGVFMCLKTPRSKQNRKKFVYETCLFKKLYAIFKNIELVSIVLRFIDPDTFGIYSPPVTHIINSPRGKSHKDEYINYLKILWIIKDDFGLDNIAFTEMFLWTLSFIEFDEKEELNNDKSRVMDESMRITLKKIIPKNLNDKTEFQIAKIFFDSNFLNGAAKFAGNAFEDVVKNIYCNKLFRTTKKVNATVLEKVQKLIPTYRENIPSLKYIWDLRCNANHHSEHVFTKDDVSNMIDAIDFLESI